MEKIFILLAIVLILPVSGWGATYYVDNAGNDSCDGTSQNLDLSGSCAWQTIAKVNASTFQPGDFILFKRGGMWREQLTARSSGNATNMITIGGYGAGDKPVINGSEIITGWSLDSGNIYKSTISWTCKQLFQDGQILIKKQSKADLAAGSWYQDPLTYVLYIITKDGTSPAQLSIEASKRAYGIYLNAKSYIQLDGLAVRQTNDMGAILIKNYASGNLIQNCEITYGYGTGILIDYYSSNNKVLSSKISFSYYAEGNYQFYASNGIMLRDYSNGNTVFNNEFFSNYGSGIFITNASNNIIDKNKIYDNGASGIDVNDQQSNNNLVKNNVVYRNGLVSINNQGISFYSSGVGNIARGNTVYEQHGGPDDGAGIEIDTTSNQVIVENNIVYNNSGHGLIIWMSKSGVLRNNTSYGNGKTGIFVGGTASSGTQVVNNITSNNLSRELSFQPEAVTAGSYDISYNDFFKNGVQYVINFNNRAYDASGFNSAFPGSFIYQVDPMFAAPTTDFSLSNGSPCIDKGKNVGLLFSGAAPDLGALEYGVLAAPTNLQIVR